MTDHQNGKPKPDEEPNEFGDINPDIPKPRVPKYDIKAAQAPAPPSGKPSADQPPQKKPNPNLELAPDDTVEDPFMQNMLLSAEDFESDRPSGPVEFDENPKVAVLQLQLTQKENERKQLEQRIKVLEGEVAQAKDQALRGLAEAENARKRALKEREDAMKYSVAGFAREILDLADNLRRAIESFPSDFLNVDPRLKNFFEGIEVTERALMRSLEMQGIKKIEPLDVLFNPNFHEVMFEAPGTGKPAGTIIQVIEPGFILKDRLLRPARVGIAKDEGQSGGSDGDPLKSPMTPGGHIDTKA